MRIGEDTSFVSIVVPVYNGESTIKNCLDSIIRLKYHPQKIEVILVDDGSTDRTVDLVKEYPIKLIRKEHGGYPSAMNAGIKVARGEMIVIVDSDIYVSEDWLIKIVDEFRDPNVGIVSGYVATAPTSSFWAKVVGFAAEDCYDTIESKYLDFITSTCTAYRRQLFAEVGLFNEALRRGSDEDLAQRALEAGWKIVLQKDAVCYHEWVPSFRRYFKNQVSNMVYQIKNFLWHPELLRGKEQHPMSLYVPLVLMLLLVLTPLWILVNMVWVSPLSVLGLVLYHIPQAVRIIRKHRDWSMLLFPIVFNVRYVAWIIGIAIGLVREATSR